MTVETRQGRKGIEEQDANLFTHKITETHSVSLPTWLEILIVSSEQISKKNLAATYSLIVS